ncbi:MAG: sodium:solute symporter family protein [Candidatus Eremiobacteraeota bacterium]|nr:sodium:solute symporter family protein [Candidatus Eremiobacteraeota bacterium]
MTPPLVSLCIVAAIVVLAIALGMYGARGRLVDPQEYIVGGRSFGALFLWLLLAGEIYTSFTFLGAAGWAYGKGAPAFYIICYGAVAYIVSYFLLPPIWEIAKRRQLLTGPDFFAWRYSSRALGVLTALIGFVFLIPYVTLQLTGLQILLTIAGYGAFDAKAAVLVAFSLIALFVFAVGLRGTAWAAVVKDALVLVAVCFAGIALPVHFFGSPAHVIAKVMAAKPGWLTLSGSTPTNGTTWFVSTVILSALGFFMWPGSMAAAYAARDADTLRRNAIFLPLYQLMLLLVYFAGFTALLILPGMKGAAADRSFMLVVQRFYPPWVLGSVAAAGCLAALVPAASQTLAAASIISKNVLGDWLGLALTDRGRLRATRVLVLITAACALALWLGAKTTLVDLLLIGYNGITQFFPGVVLGLVWPRASAWGVGAGIIVGIGIVAWSAAAAMPTIAQLNSGLVALGANALVCIGVSLATRPRVAAAPAAQT